MTDQHATPDRAAELDRAREALRSAWQRSAEISGDIAYWQTTVAELETELGIESDD